MTSQFYFCNLLLAVMIFLLAGCSSLPSVPLPSLSWSSPKVEANPDATALFREGVEYLDNKKYALAIDRFQRVKTEFPFSPELADAELKLAEAYYLSKQYPEAATAFKEFQMMHPNHENAPFAVYHLGLSYLDQFTSVDRELKTTELAKGYFETVIKDYPKSDYAPLAQEKLAQCLEYLAEQEFMVASFYLRQEKYPAARDRFDGIVRRYRDTSIAPKALYGLGETYRLEKNPVKAGLAYAALLQHYPESELAAKAQGQLAEVMQEKQDPLAMLLMRDGRAPATAAPAEQQAIAGPRTTPSNLVAKKGVVHEEAGNNKGIFRRVVDKINPFASDDDGDTPKKQSVQAKQTAGKKAAEEKSEPGFFSSALNAVNPFAQSEKPSTAKASPDPQLTKNIDASLQQKGIDASDQPLKAPASDLSQIPPEQAADPANAQNVLREVDAKLDQNGNRVANLPSPPEAHPALNEPPPKENPKVQPVAQTQGGPSPDTASVLDSIDQTLKRQGIDATSLEAPAPVGAAAGAQQPARPSSTTASRQQIELDSRLPEEKGPLFLEGRALPAPPQNEEQPKAAEGQDPAMVSPNQLPPSIVAGPPSRVKETTLDPKPAEKEDSGAIDGAFDQMRKDAEALRKALNPLSW